MTRKTEMKAGLLGAVLGLAMIHPAAAFPGNMQTAGITSPPVGHYEFCRTAPQECQADTGSVAPLSLTRAMWNTILEVNYTVNETIFPLTDKEIYGVEEHWAYPETAGDCEDYVLLKRRELMEKGIAASDLLITVVLQPNGEGHAVLTVRTDRGDFVLDNMRNKVLLWSDTEYTFLKRQSDQHAGRWVKIQDGRTVAVGSVRSQ